MKLKIHGKIGIDPDVAACGNPRARIMNFWRDKVTCKNCLKAAAKKGR